jgi:hypothetical protein
MFHDAAQDLIIDQRGFLACADRRGKHNVESKKVSWDVLVDSSCHLPQADDIRLVSFKGFIRVLNKIELAVRNIISRFLWIGFALGSTAVHATAFCRDGERGCAARY